MKSNAPNREFFKYISSLSSGENRGNTVGKLSVDNFNLIALSDIISEKHDREGMIKLSTNKYYEKNNKRKKKNLHVTLVTNMVQ